MTPVEVHWGRARVMFGRLGGAAVLLALVGVAACDGERWVVASQFVPRGDAGPYDGGVSPQRPGCPSVEALRIDRAQRHASAGADQMHVGSFRGTLTGSAAAAFPANEVALTVGAEGGGTLELFSDAPLAAPNSASESYLCDGSVSGGVCGSVSGFVAGFEYELRGGRSRGDVLSFVILDADPWQDWCALQLPTAVPDPDAVCGNSFRALPPGTPRWSASGCEMVREGGGVEAIDCGLMYALQRCQCAYDGCVAEFVGGVEVGLKASADGAELSGFLWFTNGVDAAMLRLSKNE